jgi:CheY-like chemotaxis protein
MATLRKRGSRWHVQVRRSGQSHTRSFSYKEDAEAWGRKTEREIDTGEIRAVACPMSLILLLEDDEDLRPILADALRSVGHEVVAVAEGSAALKKSVARRPDLIISDIVMEGMEGIAAIMAFRKLLGTVPILAISGNALYLNNSEKLGADAGLLKPFTRKILMETVNRLLGHPSSPYRPGLDDVPARTHPQGT